MSDFKALDRLLQGYVDNGLPGCSCMIARRGEIKLYHVTVLWSKIFYNLEIQASSVVQLFAV